MRASRSARKRQTERCKSGCCDARDPGDATLTALAYSCFLDHARVDVFTQRLDGDGHRM
jgi:hypothetical protein